MVGTSRVTGNMTDQEYMDYKVTEHFGVGPTTLLIIYSSIALLGLLGVVGNVVSIVVWTRPQVKSSSSILLTVLAACDFLIPICEICPIYSYVLYLNYPYSPAIDYMSKFIVPHFAWLIPVSFTAKNASVYLTLAITLERYIAVCRPFQALVVCTYSRACRYAAAIITISILYNLPEFLKFKVVPHFDDNGDVAYYHTTVTELGESPLFVSFYRIRITWLYLTIAFLLPLTCIAVLNTLIYLEMKRVEKRRPEISVSQRKESKLTRMLVYVVAEFFVCSSLSALWRIFMILELSGEELGFKKKHFAPLIMFFDIFNSSSNVLIYIMFGSVFREALLGTFSCCRGPCRLGLPSRTNDRELTVGTAEIPNSKPTSGNQTPDPQV